MDQVHRFIKCTSVRGNKILVDANRVRSVREVKENNSTRMITNIYCENPPDLRSVVDTIEEVHGMLEDALRVDF